MELEAARQTQGRLLGPLCLKVASIKPDGNCLFRAVAHQLFRDEERHAEVRAACVDYLRHNRAFYRDFVAGRNIDEHIARMRRAGEWGDHLELQALSDLYATQIEVFSSEEAPTVIYAAEGGPRRVIRLFYNNLVHYDSVVETTPRDKDGPGLDAALRRQRTQLEKRNAVICRRNLAQSAGLSLRQIVERSLAQMDADFDRQADCAAAESEQSGIEEAILRQVMRETAKEPPFDLFAALVAMGYSEATAVECVMNFGPEERDIGKVANFISMSSMF